MQNKKIRILSCLCTTAAIAATVGSVFIVTNTNKKPDIDLTEGDFTLTYKAGEDGKFTANQKQQTRVYAGSHLEDVYQPEVECLDQNKGFAGWVDETGKPFYSKDRINKNMTLTAVYSSNVTASYCHVRFSPGAVGVALQGNLLLNVKKYYRFYMINRPQATADNKVFKGWALESDPEHIINENTEIVNDMTLVPVFDQAVTIEWNGMGAKRVRGTKTSTVLANTPFNEINQPSFDYGTKYFAGWYKDKDCTIPWSNIELVEFSAVAYAKWIDQPTEGYCRIEYVQKPGETVEPQFSLTAQTVLREQSWYQFNKPTVWSIPNDYRVEHWEMSTDGGSSWVIIQDDTVFDYEEVLVAPILVPNIEQVIAFGPTSVTTQTTAEYNSYVFGSETKDVTWDVYDQPECQPGQESTLATIDEAGSLTVGYCDIEGNTVYVKATSTVDPSMSQVIPVTITLPYEDSTDIWFTDGADWYSFDFNEIHKVTNTYIVTKLNGESSVISSSDPFTNKIYIGRNTHAILDNFFVGFTGFNGEIDFNSNVVNGKVLNSGNNVTWIGDSFLEKCESFNQYLSLSQVEHIGDNFLFGCKQFNNGFVDGEGEAKPLDLSSNTSMPSIGDCFLDGCESFNQQIMLPDGGALTSIGEYFLYGCVKFNSPINFPSTLTTVKPFCMLNCNSFTSTITVDCPIDAFKGNDQQFCASSPTFIDPSSGESVDSAIYSDGFYIDGAFKAQFKERFDDAELPQMFIYRKNTVLE